LSPPVAPAANSHRAQITLNGTTIPAIKAEATNTSHLSADTFRLELSAKAVLQAAPLFTPAYWSSTVAFDVTIAVGSVTSGIDQTWSVQPTQFFAGGVDKVEYDFRRGLITLTGRDYASRFIDNKIELDPGSFTNLTSSEIAIQLAGNRNLQTDKITATDTVVGTWYSGNAAMMMQDRTEWDLLTYLAQQEGFIVAVIGTSLYFGPATSGSPYVVQYTPATATTAAIANVEELKVEHNLTLARGINVTVSTFNQQDGIPHTRTATGKPKGVTIPSGATPSTYVINLPNATPDQIENEVNNRIAQFVAYERPLDIELPGDETLTITQPLQLTGTGTSWDATYAIDTIHRVISLDGGFDMTVRAKVGTPQTVSFAGGNTDEDNATPPP
jgi:hypothetical protein